MDSFFLPAGCQIRICRGPIPWFEGRTWMQFGDIDQRSVTQLIIAPPGVEPVKTNIVRPGMMSAVVVMDPGCDWPDDVGLRLIAELLVQNEIATLQFSRLSDALRCEAGLRAGRRP